VAVLFPSLLVAASAEDYLSPCDVDPSPDGTTLYITAATGEKVLCFDRASNKVAREIPLKTGLTGLAVTSDGGTLVVTGGGHKGRVLVVDASSGKLRKEIPAGHTPMSPVLSPDDGTLYVCNRFDGDVSIIDLGSGATTARVPVRREPVAADLTPDGKLLFVANHIPDGPADADYVASVVSVIDTDSKEATAIQLVNGAQGLRDLRVSPDGRHVFATHLMSRFLVPTTQLERGWVNTDAISLIRVSDISLQYTVLLDDVARGFANPWAIGFSGDGRMLVVSSAGNHEISLIDLPGLMEKMRKEAAASDDPAHLNAHNNLSFLSGLRERVPLDGNGPRALAVVDNTAYVAHYFTDSLEMVDLSTQGTSRQSTVRLAPELPLTPERRGEILFNDANLCFQNWLSCATCHPDARTDALNWDLLNDGIGNPKNVKSMLLAHQTPRAMALGVRADAETGVRAGMTHIQFSVRPEEEARAIDAYLKGLKPVPSPFLVDGQLSEAAQRGEKAFKKAGCAMCHPAPLFTNLKMYDVGTTKGQDKGKPVDTPTLVEIWRTAPYLHDGRAATLKEVFTTHNHPSPGESSLGLSEQEIDDMVEYLLSL